MSTSARPQIGEILDRSWNSIKDQLALVAGLTLVVIIATAALNMLPFGALLNSLITCGYVACLYKIIRKEQFEFSDFLWSFQNMNRFLNVLVMTALSTVITIIGFVLLIIPGIWVMVALSLSGVLIVRDNMGGIDALKKSKELVTGNWWYMFLFLIVMGLINVLGAMCFLIGLLVSIPVSMVAWIHMTEALAAGSAPANPSSPVNGTESSTFAVNPS